MSTKKTENYQLHAWELEDDFLLREINENFEKLDVWAVRAVAGCYVGDGKETREFELGFRPKMVILVGSSGIFNTTAAVYGGMAVDGSENKNFVITDTGFRLERAISSSKRNMESEKYSYAVFV